MHRGSRPDDAHCQIKHDDTRDITPHGWLAMARMSVRCVKVAARAKHLTMKARIAEVIGSAEEAIGYLSHLDDPLRDLPAPSGGRVDRVSMRARPNDLIRSATHYGWLEDARKAFAEIKGSTLPQTFSGMKARELLIVITNLRRVAQEALERLPHVIEPSDPDKRVHDLQKALEETQRNFAAVEGIHQKHIDELTEVALAWRALALQRKESERFRVRFEGGQVIASERI